MKTFPGEHDPLVGQYSGPLLPIVCPSQLSEMKFLHLEKCLGNAGQSHRIPIPHHFVHDPRYDLP